jgi:hypothetical protein
MLSIQLRNNPYACAEPVKLGETAWVWNLVCNLLGVGLVDPGAGR